MKSRTTMMRVRLSKKLPNILLSKQFKKMEMTSKEMMSPRSQQQP
jgi:hypothetical protein|tara:strand:- start:350 stop:484 length:135 start_codon:yes stop_codon:yes gene_type:complete